jgi:hypothetical protein
MPGQNKRRANRHICAPIHTPTCPPQHRSPWLHVIAHVGLDRLHASHAAALQIGNGKRVVVTSLNPRRHGAVEGALIASGPAEEQQHACAYLVAVWAVPW